MKAFHFENTNSDFNHFLGWIQQLMKDQGMEKVIVGMEPTGHYWLNLAHFLKDQRIQFVVVNPIYPELTFNSSLFQYSNAQIPMML